MAEEVRADEIINGAQRDPEVPEVGIDGTRENDPAKGAAIGAIGGALIGALAAGPIGALAGAVIVGAASGAGTAVVEVVERAQPVVDTVEVVAVAPEGDLVDQNGVVRPHTVIVRPDRSAVIASTPPSIP